MSGTDKEKATKEYLRVLELDALDTVNQYNNARERARLDMPRLLLTKVGVDEPDKTQPQLALLPPPRPQPTKKLPRVYADAPWDSFPPSSREYQAGKLLTARGPLTALELREMIMKETGEEVPRTSLYGPLRRIGAKEGKLKQKSKQWSLTISQDAREPADNLANLAQPPQPYDEEDWSKGEWNAERRGRYMTSLTWRYKCALVRQRDGGVCERCKRRPHFATHHLTSESYERLGRELLTDLQGLCDRCHEWVHKPIGPDPALPDPEKKAS